MLIGASSLAKMSFNLRKEMGADHWDSHSLRMVRILVFDECLVEMVVCEERGGGQRGRGGRGGGRGGGQDDVKSTMRGFNLQKGSIPPIFFY